MAITKCLHMKQAKTGYPAKHLANGLRYIMNPEKTEHGRYVCGHNCIPEQALSQMVDTKRHFGKLDKRQGYHFILSFEEDEVSEEEAFQMVGEFVTEFLGKDFEAVYAVHNDTDHIHGHIIFNSVRCTTGYKYDYRNGDWENIIQPLTNRICREHGLSVLDLEEAKEKRKQKGQEEKSLSERDRRIRRDVDQALQDAGSYEEFLENLFSMGYELRGRKRLSVREPGAGRARRLDQLGEEYTEEKLRQRFGRLPIPEMTGEEIPVEWTYVFIPYRERHLTRYQKECFLRRYRQGKPMANSKTWKYRAAIHELKKLQEEFDFLAAYRIQDKAQLKAISDATKEQLWENSRARKQLRKEMVPYEEMLLLLNKLQEKQMEAELYQEGYQEFFQDHQTYQNLLGQLKEMGYSLSDAEQTDAYFFEKEERLRIERKKILKEKRIAERLREKAEEKEKLEAQQKEKNRKPSARGRGKGG